MGEHRPDLTRGVPLPATFLKALQELVGSLETGFNLSVASANSVQTVAGSGDAQVPLTFDGVWRYNTATVTASVPVGAAATFDVWATADANDLSAIDPLDNTNYGFGLAVRATGSPPTADLMRKVGRLAWDGAKITQLLPLVGAGVVGPMVGELRVYAGATDPLDDGWLIADGRAVSRTSYPALFGLLGTTFGVGDGATTFNLPDLRGRVPVGAGTGAGLTARALGTRAGEESHLLVAGEMPVGNWPSSAPGSGSWANDSFHKDGTGGAVPYIPRLLGGSSTVTNNVGGAAHNNMPPFQALNYIIRVHG